MWNFHSCHHNFSWNELAVFKIQHYKHNDSAVAPTGPWWLLVLKEGQTCFSFTPTIGLLLLEVAMLTHVKNKTQTWPLVPVCCWDNNLQRRTKAMALQWVKHKNVWSRSGFASRDKLRARWSDLLCHKSKKRSQMIMLALKTLFVLKWNHTSYKFHYEPLHICTDKDR